MELKLTSFMISWFLRMLIRWFVYYAYGKLNGVKVFVSLNIKITTLLYVSVAWLRKYMCYFLMGLHIYCKHRKISNAFRFSMMTCQKFKISYRGVQFVSFFHLRSLSYHNDIITICIKTLSSFFNSVLYLYHSRIPLVAWSQVIFEALIYDWVQSQKKKFYCQCFILFFIS